MSNTIEAEGLVASAGSKRGGINARAGRFTRYG